MAILFPERRGGVFKKLAAWVILGAGLAGSLRAELQQRLNGAAVYDTDLNVTWLANANLSASNTFGIINIPSSGAMPWQTAESWIVAMNAANYLGFNTWRLPTTTQPDPTCSNQDPVLRNSSGVSCTGSEMGHLFYSELGGTKNVALSAHNNSASYSLFQNLQDTTYWSDTTDPTGNPAAAWSFQFQNGSQISSAKQSNIFLVMAVLNGDVASPKVLPQFTFGGGWYSAMYFTNSASIPASFDLSFLDLNGQPMNIPAFQNSKTTVSIQPHGTALIEALNTDSVNHAGHVLFSLPPGVTGYGVFRQTVRPTVDLPDQEALVPFSSQATTSSTMIFDEAGLITSVAIVNLSPFQNNVTISLLNPQGQPIGFPSIVQVPANGSVPAILRNLPGLGNIVGNRGTIQFSVTSGNIAVLGLRAHGTSFTSIPTVDK